MKRRSARGQDYQADVCLLLEGTYPYVSGGVSTWVHNLISALPDLTFCGVVILPSQTQEWKQRYEPPDNFVGLEHVYIHDYTLNKHRKLIPHKKRGVRLIEQLHTSMREGKAGAVDLMMNLLFPAKGRLLSTHDMIYSREAWEMVVRRYNPEQNSDSFIDYFWTYRFTHLPLFQVLDAPKPKARCYHTISTGYAGLLGILAAKEHGRPLFLTEHGIYTKERKIEIAQAEWIYQSNRQEIKVQKELGAFQQYWIRMFEAMSRMTYHVSKEVITLYQGNAEIEKAEGCPPEKIKIIPNGINLSKFEGIGPDPGEKDGPFRVGFVGRVVPIKDVKTFLRACKLVSLRVPDAQFFIMGPTDEDEDYHRDCLALTETLGLKDNLRYTGKVPILDWYPKLDLLVLTSISEAQPLVILEANIAGIPVVASDVGACSELCYGRTEEDKALGPSGLVTGIANPSSTAEAMIKIMTDTRLRVEMSRAGMERVRRYYNEADLNETYRGIYRSYVDWRPHGRRGGKAG
jgi:glycosyltransferase involved in cell wall biosynthesis